MGLFSRKKDKSVQGAEEKSKQVKKPEPVKVEKKTGKELTPAKKKDQQVKKTDSKHAKISYKVLVHPLISEKTTIQNSFNQYAFLVDDRTNKVEIKKAIQEMYNVKPTKVRIVNYLGKMVRTGRRGATSRRKSWKKAIVVLPQGKKIDVYEGV